MKFKVDQDKCIGCGACEAICEEVFKIGDEGLAEASKDEIKDEKIKESAIDAMEGCPTGAIEEDKDEKKED